MFEPSTNEFLPGSLSGRTPVEVGLFFAQLHSESQCRTQCLQKMFNVSLSVKDPQRNNHKPTDGFDSMKNLSRSCPV